MLVDKQNVITFDMTGDEVNEITISSLQGEALTVEQIINDLNVNETFTASWTASPYGETSFIIEAKADGARVGRAGNNASIAGNAVANCTRTITGEEARPGDFDFYFGCNVLSAQDINCLVTGYNYLKTLLLYAEAIDG
jgi:hypothetical protein